MNRRNEYGPGATGVGWDLALMGLGMHVEPGEAVDPELGATFTPTPDGLAFTRVAASAWADAAIGDGDDATAARAAGERTLVFYTTVRRWATPSGGRSSSTWRRGEQPAGSGGPERGAAGGPAAIRPPAGRVPLTPFTPGIREEAAEWTR